MRQRSATEYLIDGRCASPLAQRIINDHQVRLVSKGGIYGVRLGRRRRTYIVPDPDEHFSERSGK